MEARNEDVRVRGRSCSPENVEDDLIRPGGQVRADFIHHGRYTFGTRSHPVNTRARIHTATFFAKAAGAARGTPPARKCIIHARFFAAGACKEYAKIRSGCAPREKALWATMGGCREIKDRDNGVETESAPSARNFS